MNRLALLALSMGATPTHPDTQDPYEGGMGDVDDYDPELEELLDESEDDDDHLGGPGDRLMRRIERLQGKEAQTLARINSSTGGRRKRAVNKLQRIQKSLGRRRNKLSQKLAKWVVKGRLSNADAASMAARARIPWEHIDTGTSLTPSGVNTAMVRPPGVDTTMTRHSGTNAHIPGDTAMSQQNPLPNGATAWGGASSEPVRINTAPVQVVNTTELLKAPGTETPLVMQKSGTTEEWIDVAFAIGAGGRVQWKAELPLRSYAEFDIIGLKIEQAVIGRAADTALYGTVDSVEIDGQNNLLMDKHGFSFEQGDVTFIDSLRKIGRIPTNTKVEASGYVDQLGPNAAALEGKFRVSLITRVVADRG